MDFADIKKIVPLGESDTLEFKRSTGQLTRAGETLCAFLNGNGGKVVFGIEPNGTITGQQVTDKTLQDIADTIRKIEPSIAIEITRVPLCVYISETVRV